jgi:transcriptional regulator with XRE-family HTH domain
MIYGMSAMTIQLPQRRKVPHDTFAARLVLLRHDLGLTQQQAAELTGVGRAAWNTWENGRIPQRQAEIAKKIADKTGYDLRWLLYGGVVSDTPTDDDHPTGRFPVRVRAQEQRVRRIHPARTTLEQSFRPIQIAA